MWSVEKTNSPASASTPRDPHPSLLPSGQAAWSNEAIIGLASQKDLQGISTRAVPEQHPGPKKGMRGWWIWNGTFSHQHDLLCISWFNKMRKNVAANVAVNVHLL